MIPQPSELGESGGYHFKARCQTYELARNVSEQGAASLHVDAKGEMISLGQAAKSEDLALDASEHEMTIL